MGEYVAATLASDVDLLAAELVECEGDEGPAHALTLALFERWLDERELVLAKLEPPWRPPATRRWPRCWPPGAAASSAWSTAS